MYKDKDKQREANRKAQAKFKAKGITEGITNQGITGRVLPEDWEAVGKDFKAVGDDIRTAIKKITTTSKPKRGKDIKTFEDLPPDVQQTIDSLSMVDGKICQRVKANRTAIAIHYQSLFPDRYNSTGVA